MVVPPAPIVGPAPDPPAPVPEDGPPGPAAAPLLAAPVAEPGGALMTPVQAASAPVSAMGSQRLASATRRPWPFRGGTARTGVVTVTWILSPRPRESDQT